jgi:hypothetical protein
MQIDSAAVSHVERERIRAAVFGGRVRKGCLTFHRALDSRPVEKDLDHEHAVLGHAGWAEHAGVYGLGIRHAGRPRRIGVGPPRVRHRRNDVLDIQAACFRRFGCRFTGLC